MKDRVIAFLVRRRVTLGFRAEQQRPPDSFAWQAGSALGYLNPEPVLLSWISSVRFRWTGAPRRSFGLDHSADWTRAPYEPQLARGYASSGLPE